MQETAGPLLTTKLYIPPPRPNVVPRPRLMQRMDEALRVRHRLTLVSAKAGSGKTTAVSEWLHQQARPGAWLSLDANDDEPVRFFRYLVAALQTAEVEVGQVVLGQLESAGSSRPEALVAELINDLAGHLSPFLLVLDDYHLVRHEWIHQAVEFLAAHQPPQMHLILITRVDPPLPLTRLRGRGQMTEIRDRDLRFTVQETDSLVNRVMKLDLPAMAVSTLEQRTEGWIVGLQMAALAMQATAIQASAIQATSTQAAAAPMPGRGVGGDLVAFIEAFDGTNRYILDYLIEEVLRQQPPALQDFLVETCILERMCGPLCDAARFGQTETAARDSQSVLAHLEQINLFVTPLDSERRWYRYHHLFADLLGRSLRERRSEEEIRGLYRRASQWHQGQGSIEEAVTYAMAAQDYERAASMIEQRFTSILGSSEVPVLLGWIDQLPERVVRSHPWIDVYRATTLVLAGRLEEVDALLDGVERRTGPDRSQVSELVGHIAAVRAYAANLRGDAPAVIEMAALADTCLQDAHVPARGMAAYALADTYFAGDDVGNADRLLQKMLQVGETTGQPLLSVSALCDLASIRKVQGRLYQAQDLYNRAHEKMVERNGLESRVRCAYEFGLADLLCEWNQLDAAHEHAMTGIAYRRRLGGYWVVGDVPLMRILQAQGDVDGALRTLREVEQIVETHAFQQASLIAFKTARVVQWLAAGDLETASRWAVECNGGSELEQIALARLRLAQGRAEEAQSVLERQRALADAGGRTGRLIEILALLALALDARDRPEEAETALSRSLSLARTEGYARSFLQLGRPLWKLLRRLAMRDAATSDRSAATKLFVAQVRDLLDAFQRDRQSLTEVLAQPPSFPAEAQIDSLTDRELEVLRLLADGLSNKTIASKLFVAPSTVKQHLKHVYDKLDVHSRTQAVARGRELGLL